VAITIGSNVKDPDRIRERRAQIVTAAVQLFAEKGFHKTTTREIAKAAGLSNGALYEYVESKEDVLYLVCQHIHREMADKLSLSLSPHATGAERLKHAILAFFQVISHMQDDILLIYQESKSLPPSFLREVLREENQITQVFEQLLTEGRQDASLRLDVSAIPLLAQDIVVLGQMWAFRRWGLREVEFARFAEQQLEMLMHACGANAADTEVRTEFSRG
jgi:TetR/AcrR family transcriptional regulator, cholesterol catabolism regulator